jgi:hypothetical protein
MAINPHQRGSPVDTQASEFNRTDQRYRTGRAVCRYLLIGFGLWQGRLAIDALAGQTTDVYVKAALGAFAELRVSVLLTLAGAASVWALLERYLRHRIIVRLHTRIRDLETNIDPERSSSGLTTKGQTNPSDREI